MRKVLTTIALVLGLGAFGLTAHADEHGEDETPDCVDINEADAEDLALLAHVGDEGGDALTAQEVIDARPIETVGDLAKLPEIGGPQIGVHREPAKIAELVVGQKSDDVPACGFTVATMEPPDIDQPAVCDDPATLVVPEIEGVASSHATGDEVEQEDSVTVTSGFVLDGTVVADFRANFDVPFVDEDDHGGWRDHIDYDNWTFVWPELTAEVAPQGCPGDDGKDGDDGSDGQDGQDGTDATDDESESTSDDDTTPASTQETLPDTGVSLLWLAGGGIVLVLAGGAMALRRRTQ